MQIDSSAAALQPMAAPDSDIPVTGFRKWAPLFIMALALAIIIIDTTVLNVSLRNIITDLDTDIHKIQWVITAYSLILSAFTITGGRLGDLFGRKKMFVIGAIIFAAGSIITALSTSVGMILIGNAVIEGLGACLMLPATSALLISNYKGRDRSLAFGVWGGIAAASAALGPVLGGWLTKNYSWRWAFGINPIVVLLLLAGIFLIKEARDMNRKPGLDIGGIILSSLGLLSIAFGFTQASVFGWLKAKEQMIIFGSTINLGSLSATPLFILAGLLLLGGFILWERMVVRKGNTPLVSLKLFRNKQFIVGATITAILALGQMGIFFSIPVFLQAVKNLDPLATGLAMLPISVSILIVAPLSSFLSKYISPKHLIQTGLVLNIIGYFILRQSLTVDVSAWGLLPGFATFGAGMGLIFAQVSNVALSAVPVAESGEASGINNTMRQIGATFGAAVIGAILISSLSSNLVDGVKDSRVIPDSAKPSISQSVSKQSSSIEFGGGDALNSQNIPETIKNEITTLSHQATADADRTVLIYAIIFIFFGLLVSFWLPNGKNIEHGSAVPDGNSESLKNHEPTQKTVAISAKTVAIALAALVLAGGGGYLAGKERGKTVEITTDTSPDNTAIAVEEARPATASSASPAQPVNQLEAVAYKNDAMRFSLALPADWKINEKENEVIVISPDEKTYSIQMYDVKTNDMQSLQAFLVAQPNVHAITNATVAAHNAFIFTIDGVYRNGSAFLDNGRLYYMLGENISSTPIAQSFKTI